MSAPRAKHGIAPILSYKTKDCTFSQASSGIDCSNIITSLRGLTNKIGKVKT